MNHFADLRKKVDPMKILMKSLAEDFIDYNALTRPQKARAWWYAVIIFAPVIAVIAAHLLYGPGLDRVMGW